VSLVVVDDHLLRAAPTSEGDRRLRRLVEAKEIATTNLYYIRLYKSVVAAGGGKLTGGWSDERRRELGRRLIQLPESVRILPMSVIGYRVAEVALVHRVSTLGAEAVAAAEQLRAPLWVWDRDDGPNIREAARRNRVPYRTVSL
jgi:hypothetical protein